MHSYCDENFTDYKSIYDDSNGVLKNKLGIKNVDELNQVEKMITTKKISELGINPINQSFDVNHYLAIHKYLFEDIYPFAGEIRCETIQKDITFCVPEYIYINLKETLEKAKKKIRFINNREDLLSFIVTLYADLDVIHPFREGNGRTEREFIREFMQYICQKNNLDNYFFDYNMCSREEYLDAVIDADTVSEVKLYNLFDKIMVNKNELEKGKNL